MADVTMPQLGETVTEGTITKWMKKVGDKVDADEVLFEVSTDKVDSEVPSPAAGYVAEILVEEGETVDVGVKLAVISSDAPGDGDGSAPAEAEEEPQEAEEPQQKEQEPTPEQEEQEAEPEPEPAAEAEPEPEEPEQEPEERKEPARAEAKPSAGTRPSDSRPAARPSGGGGKVLSPVVRRLIAEHDLDPESIEGTGAGGRITRADVLKVIDGGARAPKKEAQPEAAPAEGKPKPEPKEDKAPTRPAPAPAAKAGDRDEVVAFSNIRKRTAEHMVRSKATSAHTLVVIEVDYDGVERVRKALKDRFRSEEGFGLSYLPFISRAVVDAIREFPHVNSSVGDNELIIHHDVNLGVAVDLNFEGLIVPVVQGADGKRLRAIAREIADLADRARKKKLGMDEISGGTFTLTNAGGYGTFITGPIINQPQVAILSTDGVKMRPVAVEVDEDEWAVAIHPTGNLALAWDHRAFDGAYAAAFLAKVKDILETRDWSQEF
jgi:pyruvate dehydrogenase E2 component (dihydrolipoamide acetyltransferase)